METPVHVTVIMGGNGRWAKQRGEDRVKGHIAGTESVRACCRAAVQAGVKYLSLYAFSQENWNRPQAEVSALMELLGKCLVNEIPMLMENGIRIRLIGDRTKLSQNLLQLMENAEHQTENNQTMTLLIMLSYSDKWDIEQAAEAYARDYAEKGKGGTAPFENYLSTAGIPDPDLLIRTSGEQRLSNYMLWQTAYTEFYFTDILWPDFRESDFSAAVESFKNRDRRYGKVK
ncbi:MAG: di-trans,poly-cis-decaprenylcistransferase [Bacteroidales bacterium]|nr:di-trans,poly-cis-decaprenylcistransferase [Candidatus Equibacterium intestinale]